MRNFWKIGWVLLAVCLSCHKSASSPGLSAALSGPYIENSPVAGESTLNFVGADRVIAQGYFFLEPLSTPDTLNYFLSAASGNSLISFVTTDFGYKDTLTCNFAITGATAIEISFNPCPPGVPCDALGGAVFIYKK